MSDKKMIEQGRHHVSKTYIPLMLFRWFWIMLVIAVITAVNLLEGTGELVRYLNLKNMIFLVVTGVVILMGVLSIIAFLSYKRLTWEITDEEVHIYKGLIVKKKSHIPFRRIHSVNIEAKILDRIFGVVTVKLDTAAGSAKSEDAKIPAMALSTAEMLRSEIFRRKQAVQENKDEKTATGGGNVLEGLNRDNDRFRGIYGGDFSEDLIPEAEYRLTNKELILLCISNGKAFAIIFACLLFVSQFMGILGNVNENAANEAEKMIGSVILMGPIIIVLIFIVALIASFVISFITRALTYGNFVARRYGERIEISRGLLQKRSIGVAVERIQTLKIKQGLIQRILGFAEISLETASGMGKSGNDQQNDPGVVIHPFIKVNRIDDYMSKMLKEYDDRPIEMRGLSLLAMRRSMVRYGIFSMILILLPINIIWWILKSYAIPGENISADINSVDNFALITSIVILAVMILTGWAVWKGKAYAKSDRYLALRKGILGRTKIYISKKKIQYAQVSQNPFQRRVDLTTIKANTAAMGSSFQSIKDIERKTGDQYLGWIEHKSN